MMPGFVLAAIPFTAKQPLPILLERGGLLSVATLFLVASVYGVNSYYGFHADRLNPRLSAGLPEVRRAYPVVAGVALLISLSVFALIRPLLAGLAAGVFFLWLIYSVSWGAKGRPIWGTVIHFITQIAQFHLGILAFGQVSLGSLGVSVFFALVFSCGHLMHELKDFESDRSAGIRTNAVVFGPSQMSRVYRTALLILPPYWAALFFAGLLTQAQFFPFLAASISHAIASRFWDGSVPSENISFQRLYRAGYLTAGLLALGLW
jgi:4-hydroxybenzoate polyprenyltransferase